MKRRIALVASSIIALVTGCSDSGTTDAQAPSPGPAEAAAPVVTRANSVVVDDGAGGTHIMGAIRYALGQGGEFTGALGRGEPDGPVIIYIFRKIPPPTRQFFSDAGVDIRENAAYLWPESAPYDAESIKRLRFVRAIDPAFSDEALAAEFGVNVSAAPPPVAPGG